VDTDITYEQPLNERVRTFLRMEHLFKLVDHHIKGASEWDSRGTLSIILDIMDLLSRSDIKTELIKELDDCTHLEYWQVHTNNNATYYDA